jgi:hypothetical protein
VVTRRKQLDKPKLMCTQCGKEKDLKRSFFTTDSSIFAATGRYPVCKDCIKTELNISENIDLFSQEFLTRFQNVLRKMDKPFIYNYFVSSVRQIQNSKNNVSMKNLFGIYYKNAFSMNRGNGATWNDSEFEAPSDSENKNNDIHNNIKKEYSIHKVEIIDKKDDESYQLDERNRKDVLRILGYDPFEGEQEDDKRYLYNRLVDSLNDDTLSDGFKLQSYIELAKGFNQVDKINRALAETMSNIADIATKGGGVKSLVDAKKTLLMSMMKLAQDNCISENYNKNKSKGAGTLSGILKELQNKKFNEAKVNLFDIETAKGIEQVAELSNKAILSQLKLDENDYNEMLSLQNQAYIKIQKENEKLIEENRVLREKISNFEIGVETNE